MLEQLLFKLLEQTPVIIALGVGIYATWKEKRSVLKEAKEERESHKAELRTLYEDSKKKEVEYLDTLRDVANILKDVEQGQIKTQTEITSLKEYIMTK